MSDATGLSPCACFRARNMARAITALYDETIEGCGLRTSQFATMVSIGLHGAIRMQELAAELGLDPSTMTRTLQPLERDGYVTSEPGEDRRVRELALTPRGHRKLAEAQALWMQAQERLRAKLGDDRFDRLFDDMGEAIRALRE